MGIEPFGRRLHLAKSALFGYCSAPHHPNMKPCRIPLALVALALAQFFNSQADAQFSGGGNDAARAPLQIESRTEVQRIGTLAVAKGDVVISVGDTTIYCDYAQYNQETRDVMVSGDVRIFRGGKIFAGDRAIYNLESKKLTGSDFRAASGPLMAHAHGIAAAGKDAIEISGATFTADDSPDPGLHIKARKVRFFHNDHTEYEDVTVYVGRTAIFWVPYLYQPAKLDQSFSISPGSRSNWGPFLMTRTLFSMGTDTVGAARIDYLAKRGIAIGLDADRKIQESGSWSRLRSYYVNDSSPTSRPLKDNLDGPPTRENATVGANRYRVSLQDRSFISDTLYTSLNFNKLSDVNYLEDFAPGELRHDPNPDSVLNITKWDEDYTLSLQFRKQFNEDFEGSGKTPELALDVKRQPFLQSGFFYESENSISQQSRKYVRNDQLDPYNYLTHKTLRADTFHQWTYPKMLGGLVSVVPRVGIRATHYGESVGDPSASANPGNTNFAGGERLNRITTNLGVEASMKFSRTFESVESRKWGLDGLKHVVQPFANLSVVSSSQDASKVLPIDSLNPSTTLPPLDFPQFNAIDSITDWKILRLGVRNRLLTRRDAGTFSWLEMDTFLDNRIEKPQIGSFGSLDPGTFSNLFNRLRWSPLPWMQFNLATQTPVFDEGFSEVNLDSTFQPSRDFTFSVGNRHISGVSGLPDSSTTFSNNLQFQDSDLLYGSARVRINDDWAISAQENFEMRTRQPLYQRYSIDRSLRSWIASLSLLIFERNSQSDISVLFTLSLKDLPRVRLPMIFDPSASASSSNVKNQ